MRGMARTRSFLADSVFAVDHRRFFGVEQKGNRELIGDGAQLYSGITLPFDFPISVPDDKTFRHPDR